MVASVDALLSAVGFTDEQIKQVHNGVMVKETVASNHDRELAVRLGLSVKSNINELKSYFFTDPKLKQADDSMQAIGLIDEDAPDFSGVHLDDDMVHAYLKATAGSGLNLSKQEISACQALAKHGGQKTEVEKHFQTLLLNRYKSYRDQGLAGILPYHRKGGIDFHPGDELRLSLQAASLLKKECPLFHNAALNYPNSRPKGLEESFFWLNALTDDKTTVSLMHHMGMEDNGMYIVLERQFYVSRSHNSVQGLGCACPVDATTTIIAYCTRTSTDQVAGFGGATKRSIGARIMAGKVAQNFERARENLPS